MNEKTNMNQTARESIKLDNVIREYRQRIIEIKGLVNSLIDVSIKLDERYEEKVDVEMLHTGPKNDKENTSIVEGLEHQAHELCIIVERFEQVVRRLREI